MALKLSALGFVVIATCRRKESVDEWRSKGIASFELDVSSMESIEAAKKETEAFLNDNGLVLWGIINNAGISHSSCLFEWIPSKKIEQTMNVNLFGVMNVCQRFIPLLFGRTKSHKIKGYRASNGGRIINISSVAAIIKSPSMTVYGASKAAVSPFTHGLRTELSPRFGIWCSVFEIGMVSLFFYFC